MRATYSHLTALDEDDHSLQVEQVWYGSFNSNTASRSAITNWYLALSTSRIELGTADETK